MVEVGRREVTVFPLWQRCDMNFVLEATLAAGDKSGLQELQPGVEARADAMWTKIVPPMGEDSLHTVFCLKGHFLAPNSLILFLGILLGSKNCAI